MKYEKGNHQNPEVRRSFKRLEDLCFLINRSKPYVSQRLCGHKEFTEREKVIIRNYIKELEAEAV